MRNLLLVILLIVGVGYLYYHRHEPGSIWSELFGSPPTETSGPLDPAKAREVGAEIGERTARAANTVVRAAREVADEATSAIDEGTSGTRAGDALSERGMTARIKSSLALDKVVQARNINVDTSDGVVTLTGVVGSEEERTRALEIASRTPGVKRVVDRLKVAR